MFARYCRGSNCSLARAMDGRISAAAPPSLTDQLPRSIIVKRGPGFSFSFCWCKTQSRRSVRPVKYIFDDQGRRQEFTRGTNQGYGGRKSPAGSRGRIWKP